MTDGMQQRVEAVRRFNRFYTRQIGLLQEGLLESPFSLTEVRVLYELAHRNRPTAVELCRDLGLDAGYLSRMIRGFEIKGLISRLQSKDDGRQNLLALTTKGRATFAPLNRKSTLEVLGLLRELPLTQQEDLVAAMMKIENHLGPKGAKVFPPFILRDPRAGDMGWVIYRHGVLYANEWGYDWRFEALVAEIVAQFVQQFDPTREKCWIADRADQNVGAVFLVAKSKTVAKLRLLLVEPSARGMGIGRRLVEECVKFAKEAGYRKIELWTQSELTAARHIYKQSGFECVGEKRHQSWGRKELVSEVWQKKL